MINYVRADVKKVRAVVRGIKADGTIIGEQVVEYEAPVSAEPETKPTLWQRLKTAFKKRA